MIELKIQCIQKKTNTWKKRQIQIKNEMFWSSYRREHKKEGYT